MGHQGCKIEDPDERRDFLEWLDRLEYSTFGIPRPDRTLFLYVPAAIGQQLVEKKDLRSYIEDGTKDIHEADLTHLKAAEQTYLEISRIDPGWRKIECIEEGRRRRKLATENGKDIGRPGEAAMALSG